MHSPSPTAADPTESAVLGAVASVVRELGGDQAARRVALHSRLDGDLGLGSLERVELLVRVESAVGTRLPEVEIRNAETPADWVRAVREAGRAATRAERWPIVQPAREAHPAPTDASSFAAVLRRQVERDPARVQIHLLDRDEGEDISHARLFASASRVAAGLVESGLQPGQTVAIMLPTCEAFFSSFLGVTLAGGIAVPVYPPARASQIEQYVRRQTAILQNADVRFLISFDRIRALASALGRDLPSLREAVSAPELEERGRGRGLPDVDPADIFFIQYTSGSTGNPKGVALTHANVLANIRGIGWSVQVKPSDTVVSWLPLYHDMGLIGSWLFSLYHGLPITVLSPLDFLMRPERWLWAMSDSKGTLCPAPNFAFELCVRKVTDQAMEGVDLSPWRVAINAGEPVLPATLAKFTDRFRQWGFDSRAFMPYYGLAESSVALTYPPLWRGPLVDRIDRASFEEDGKAVPTRSTESPGYLEFVGNGKALPDHELRVVGDDGNAVPERTRGRIVFRGPSRTNGYFRNAQATREVLDADGWLDSGDLGYIADGELFVTGRLKDCIIKGGRNIIPQDVEMATWGADGVRKGCVAAFGSLDPGSGTERLVVVAETRVKNADERKRVRESATEEVAGKVGIPPDAVILVPPGSVPKTSSGKIQRVEARRLYESGAFSNARTASPRRQLAKLWIKGTVHTTVRRAARLGSGLKAVTANLVGGSAAIGFGMIARLAPVPAIARYATAIGARALVKLDGVPLHGRLDGESGCVVLVNRAHRADPLLIAAAFRSPFVFADRTGFNALGPAEAFLLDALVAPGDGRLLNRVQDALGRGSAVVSFADNPVGETPARTRFRAEGFAAAARNEVPAIPVLLHARSDGSVLAIQGQRLDSAVLNGNRSAGREAVRAFLAEASPGARRV